MPWWAWLATGVAVGALGYLLIGNAVAYARLRRAERPALDPRRAYIATPGARRTVNFKGEDEAEGEEIGPVFITDDEDPDFLHELGWMKLSDARELARGLGHPFAEG